MERSKIDTEVGWVASVNAVFVARCTLAPGLHARTRGIGQLLAEECVESLEHGEGVLLEGREMHIEKSMIPAGVAIGDQPPQAELGPFAVLPSEVMLVDMI